MEKGTKVDEKYHLTEIAIVICRFHAGSRNLSIESTTEPTFVLAAYFLGQDESIQLSVGFLYASRRALTQGKLKAQFRIVSLCSQL